MGSESSSCHGVKTQTKLIGTQKIETRLYDTPLRGNETTTGSGGEDKILFLLHGMTGEMKLSILTRKGNWTPRTLFLSNTSPIFCIIAMLSVH